MDRAIDGPESVTVINTIEAFDNQGDFAIAAKCVDGNPQVVAEAHLNRKTQMAYATVRGLSADYNFDAVDPNKIKIDPGAKTALDLAKTAIEQAAVIDDFCQHPEAIENITT